MDMLRLALRPGLPSPRALPRMLFADELESLDPTAWLALERVLLVHTRCVMWGPPRHAGDTTARLACTACLAQVAAGVMEAPVC